MNNPLLSLIGLIFDIIGVILLWRFGLPPNISRDGTIFLIAEQADDNEKKKGYLYDFIAHLAIALIVLGFFLQAIGTGSVFSQAVSRLGWFHQPSNILQ